MSHTYPGKDETHLRLFPTYFLPQPAGFQALLSMEPYSSFFPKALVNRHVPHCILVPRISVQQQIPISKNHWFRFRIFRSALQCEQCNCDNSKR